MTFPAFCTIIDTVSRRCNSMAECPLPKPNTRVRFPSSAPKREEIHKVDLFSFSTISRIEPRTNHRFVPRACENPLKLSTALRARLGSDSRHVRFRNHFPNRTPHKPQVCAKSVRKSVKNRHSTPHTLRFRFPSIHFF